MQSDGTLKMVKEKLIVGLTGPLGMAVSTRRPRDSPKAPFSWLKPMRRAPTRWHAVKDQADHDPKILAFNEDGMSSGKSSSEKVLPPTRPRACPATLSNALAFDKRATCISPTPAIAGGTFSARRHQRRRHLPVPEEALDDLAEGKDARSRTGVPEGGPDGIEVVRTARSISIRWASQPA